MTHTSAPAAHDDPPHGHQPGPDADGQEELLGLEAAIFAGQNASITAWLPATASPRHIVDLGSGTGAGTFALLTRFPEATVTAVDASAGRLRRLRQRAAADGLAGRVRTAQADLDGAWPELGSPELVWASAALHHLADPDRALRQVHARLAPGGLFALVEPAGFARFLPDDAPPGRAGLEERAHAAAAQRHAGQVPHRGAGWGPRLAAAGFTVEAERTITAPVAARDNEAVGRYAVLSLTRLRDSVAQALPAADLAALDQLLDPGSADSILRRDDLAVRAERTVWAARRLRTS
jgi:SAM-dependent methyltransferase